MSLSDLASSWRQYVFDHQVDMMRNRHLDFKIKILSKEDFHLTYVLDPQKVAKHQFYPFIEFTDVTRRYKKMDDGTRKSEDKPRDLCYASHQDVLVYSWYARIMDCMYEDYIAKRAFAPSVLAYRHIPYAKDAGRGKSNIHFAREVFDTIRKIGNCTVLTFDVKGFFPSIDHEQLKEMWCAILDEDQLPEDHYAVFRSLTNYAIIRLDDLLECFGTDVGKQRKQFVGDRKSRICSAEELHVFRSTAFMSSGKERKSITQNAERLGIPQGSSMSGLLSNVFMMDFDEAVCAEVKRYGGSYWRYSDDIAVVLPAGVDPKIIDDFIRAESVKKKLVMHGPEKSAQIEFSQTKDGLVSVGESLDYLGFSFDGKSILLRDKTVARYYRRMSNQVRKEASRAKKYGGRINVKKLFRQFTHLGLRAKSRKNFLSYAKNAAGATESRSIQKQVSRSMQILKKKIQKRRVSNE